MASSAATSLAEVVGGAALVFDPNDERSIAEAISRLGTDERLRESLKRKSLARAAEFTWEKTARETLGVYMKVYLGRVSRSSPQRALRT